MNDCEAKTEIAKNLLTIIENGQKPENNGYTLLGSGCSRIAYRFGDHVYKVEYDYNEERNLSNGCNLDEFNNYLMMSKMDLPVIWELPYTELHYVNGIAVIVMQYIGGYGLDSMSNNYDWYDHCNELSGITGLYDMYSCNVRYHEGSLYPIDMAG